MVLGWARAAFGFAFAFSLPLGAAPELPTNDGQECGFLQKRLSPLLLFKGVCFAKVLIDLEVETAVYVHRMTCVAFGDPGNLQEIPGRLRNNHVSSQKRTDFWQCLAHQESQMFSQRFPNMPGNVFSS